MNLSLRTKVIVVYLILSIFYAIVIGIIMKDWFTSLPSAMQFVLSSFPIFALFSIIIGGLSQPKRILGSFILFACADVVGVPFLINPDGTFGTAFLSGGASDVFIATIAQGFGVNGFILYIATYVVVPTLAVIAAVYLLKNKDLKDEYD